MSKSILKYNLTLSAVPFSFFMEFRTGMPVRHSPRWMEVSVDVFCGSAGESLPADPHYETACLLLALGQHALLSSVWVTSVLGSAAFFHGHPLPYRQRMVCVRVFDTAGFSPQHVRCRVSTRIVSGVSTAAGSGETAVPVAVMRTAAGRSPAYAVGGASFLFFLFEQYIFELLIKEGKGQEENTEADEDDDFPQSRHRPYVVEDKFS